jgi:hypothetical protein
MKKRNPIAVLLLSYITLGIYVIYWLYATRKEIVERNGNPQSIPPVWTMFASLLGFVVLALISLIFNSAADSVQTALNVIVAIGCIVFFIGLFYFSFKFMWRYCLAASELTHGTDGKTLFWLWFIGSLFGLGPIAMLMIQSDLNRYIRDQDTPAKQPPTSQTPQTPPSDQPFNPIAN